MCFAFTTAVLGGRDSLVLQFEGSTASELNQLIASAPDHSVIRLAPRHYLFDQPITVWRSNLAIVGSGRDQTHLEFLPPSTGDFIQITGAGKERIGRLTGDAALGEDTIELAPGHGLKSGDVVYLSRPNSSSFFERNNTIIC